MPLLNKLTLNLESRLKLSLELGFLFIKGIFNVGLFIYYEIVSVLLLAIHSHLHEMLLLLSSELRELLILEDNLLESPSKSLALFHVRLGFYLKFSSSRKLNVFLKLFNLVRLLINLDSHVSILFLQGVYQVAFDLLRARDALHGAGAPGSQDA